MSNEIEITVCMGVLHSNYSEYSRLIETIELNAMFGARRIVVYDYSSTPDVREVLENYRHDGLVERLPWDSMSLTTWDENHARDGQAAMQIHYFAQVAALNDCLYRNLFRSIFILFIDTDEIVVPRGLSFNSGDSWVAMLELVTQDWSVKAGKDKFPGVYVMRSVFFRPNATGTASTRTHSTLAEWLKTDSKSLQTLTNIGREDYIYGFGIRTKYFVWSKSTVMVGIHFPYESISKGIETVYVNESHGLVHHYRAVLPLDISSRTPHMIIDHHMDRYADNLIRRVNQRRLALLDRSNAL